MISLMPGPTAVHETVREAYMKNWASADTESEFVSDYCNVCDRLKTLLNATQSSCVVMASEAMVALWYARSGSFH